MSGRLLRPLKTNRDVKVARTERALEIQHSKVMAAFEGHKAAHAKLVVRRANIKPTPPKKIPIAKAAPAKQVSAKKKKKKPVAAKKRVYKRDSKGRFA